MSIEIKEKVNRFIEDEVKVCLDINKEDNIESVIETVKANSHLREEITYSLGKVQGYREAIDDFSESILSERNKMILQAMEDIIE